MAAPIPDLREGAPAHGRVAHLLPQSYKRMIAGWLEEDTPSFDYGGFVVGEGLAEARLLGKSPGLVAGVPFFDEVFKQLDCTVEWHIQEGASFAPIAHCATVRGPVRKILLGERVALNTLARCSGIATKSAQMLALLRQAGYPNALAGTRKTTPGFRLVEKYGMLVGGADPHRHDLSSMVMLKDNHIWACSEAAAAVSAHGHSDDPTVATAGAAEKSGSNDEAIAAAVRAAKAAAGFSTKVEVECQSIEEASAAIRAGADVVMLDNFSPGEFKVAAKQLKDTLGRAGEGHSFLIEVSGGLTEENVSDYVCEDLDVISTSSIHQGVKHVDFSLKVVSEGQKASMAERRRAMGEGQASTV